MSPNIRTVTVKEHSLEELNPKDAEDEEEGAADDDNVADGLEAGEQGLHHQLEAGRPVDDPERAESTDQAKHTEHPEQTVIGASRKTSALFKLGQNYLQTL